MANDVGFPRIISDPKYVAGEDVAGLEIGGVDVVAVLRQGVIRRGLEKDEALGDHRVGDLEVVDEGVLDGDLLHRGVTQALVDAPGDVVAEVCVLGDALPCVDGGHDQVVPGHGQRIGNREGDALARETGLQVLDQRITQGNGVSSFFVL